MVSGNREKMKGQNPPSDDELTHQRTWAVTLAIKDEVWNWSSRKGKNRLEITYASLKGAIDNANLQELKDAFVEPATLHDVNAANNHPFMGWVHPLVVRRVSRHSFGDVHCRLGPYNDPNFSPEFSKQWEVPGT